jgi:hypothetical protein
MSQMAYLLACASSASIYRATRIALTLLIAGLIAWKMPLKRNIGRGELWRIPRGHVGDYAYPATYGRHGVTQELAPPISVAELDTGGFEAKVLPTDTQLNAAGMAVATRRRRVRALRERKRGSERSPRGGLATGVHYPQVIRHLRRARASTSGRTTARRPQLRRLSLFSKPEPLLRKEVSRRESY